jgi:hypothetical protein
MTPAKQYRRTEDGVEYWESWVEEDGPAVVHWGRLGERGEVRRFEDRAEFSDYVRTKTFELHAAGFRAIDEEDHATVLVMIPPESLPYEAADVEALWARLESWVDEELGWTGLGRCTGVDLSSEMVALAIAVDARLAVEVLGAALPASGLPEETVIAVREDEVDVVRWPPARDGEDVSDGLPPV